MIETGLDALREIAERQLAGSAWTAYPTILDKSGILRYNGHSVEAAEKVVEGLLGDQEEVHTACRN